MLRMGGTYINLRARRDHHRAGAEPLKAPLLDYVLRGLERVEPVSASLAKPPAYDFTAVLRPTPCHARKRVAALGAGAGDALAAAVFAGVLVCCGVLAVALHACGWVYASYTIRKAPCAHPRFTR
jgi:hypothetical protein